MIESDNIGGFKMDVNLNLLLGIDGKPLPQQKDAKGINDMQVVEGSDGAQHVKITDLTGDPFDIKQSLENLNASIKANKTTPIEEINVTNFPPVQNVKDVDVKAELELIKQSVADNKATNDLILEKLDSGVNTQLTGSNVENVEVELLEEDIEVEANVTLTVKELTEIPKRALAIGLFVKHNGERGDRTLSIDQSPVNKFNARVANFFSVKTVGVMSSAVRHVTGTHYQLRVSNDRDVPVQMTINSAIYYVNVNEKVEGEIQDV